MGSHVLSVLLVVVFYLHLGKSKECDRKAPGFIDIGESISFTSPNYPYPTPGGSCIIWQFSSPENSIINLYCSEFDIPGRSHACIDTFYLSPSPPLYYSNFCGKEYMALNTTHNKFELTFRSIPDDIVHPGLILYHSKRRFKCTVTALGTNSAPKGCGKNYLRNRVEGGENSQLHEWPWMVVLRYSTDKLLCGGSLISPDWILTAAHCVFDKTKHDIYVSIGDHDIYTGDDTPHTMHADVSQIIMHQGYDDDTLIHDIALIKLVNPVEYSYAISPVCLPSHLRDKSFAFEKVISTGWGQTSENGSTSDDLRKVDLQVLTNTECSRRAKVNKEEPINDHELCASKKGKSSCYGDSGGPLVWLDYNGRYQLVGIVSRGLHKTACAAKDSATVYTRVTSYIDWIEQETSSSLCSN